MALIMTDILGAVRRGLYATRSMRKPMSTVTSSVKGMAIYSGIHVTAYIIMRPAHMKTSPCAKLIRRSMP